jgi:palmitoyl-protein thioesterase
MNGPIKDIKKREFNKSLDPIIIEAFVMILHESDSMVEPRESEHFEFYVPGQAAVILPLRESPIYVEDRIGLRALDEAGRLHFLSVPGDHLEFSRQWFIDEIVHVYLNN